MNENTDVNVFEGKGNRCEKCDKKLNRFGTCDECDYDIDKKSLMIEKISIAFAFVSTFGFFIKILFF